MNRIPSIIFIFYLYPFSLFAQKVSDIVATLDKINREIEITYNLYGSKYDRYEVQLYLSQNGGQSFDKEPLTFITGNVGKTVAAGLDRKIRWRYLTENPSFTGKNIIFKVKAKLDISDYYKRISNLGGPKSALNSLLLPGWGDNKVRENKNNWWIGALSYSLVGSGIITHFSAKNNYNRYENSRTTEEAQLYLNNAQNQSKISRYLIITGATIWLTDIIIVFFKGQENVKKSHLIKSELNKPKAYLRLDYNPNWNTTGLRLGFNF